MLIRVGYAGGVLGLEHVPRECPVALPRLSRGRKDFQPLGHNIMAVLDRDAKFEGLPHSDINRGINSASGARETRDK